MSHPLCRFNKTEFENKYNTTVTDIWVELDNMTGPNIDELFNPNNDYLEDGVVLNVDCSNCTCEEDQVTCTFRPCGCVYTETEWTNCEQPCGEETQQRIRFLIGDESLCSGNITETKSCNNEPCPTVPPIWSPWGKCSYDNNTCTPGSRTRIKICNNMTTCPGSNTQSEFCPPIDECTTPSCQYPLQYDECAQCEITCKDVRDKTSTCLQSEGCVKDCVCPNGTYLYFDECVREELCPCYYNGMEVDDNSTIDIGSCQLCQCVKETGDLNCTTDPDCCEYGQWGDWGNCSKECNGGMRTRRKEILNGGENCNETNTQMESCNDQECPPPCFFNGRGYALSEEIPGYTDDVCDYCICVDVNSSITCNPDPVLQVDGVWTQWETWSSCSQSCNTGVIRRCRACINPRPECGGKSCDGDGIETMECNTNTPCCQVSEWESWSACSETCNNGTMTRNRNLENPSEICGNTELSDSKRCFLEPCDSGCTITSWTEWSTCQSPEDCGTGKQLRTRNIGSRCSVIDDIMTKEHRDCYNGDCFCENNMIWSNFSYCEYTCNTKFYPMESLRCTEFSEGCICPHNMFRDNDTCITSEECDTCRLPNGEIVENNKLFDHPTDSCKECMCVVGCAPADFEDFCWKKPCEEVKCLPDYELAFEEGRCCPKCEPRTEKCMVHYKTTKLTDASGKCKTKEAMVHTYCSGTCGASTTISTLLLLDGEISTLFKTACECCMAVFYDSTIHMDVECDDGTTKSAIYMPIEECKCGMCQTTEDQQNQIDAAASLVEQGR